jgi:hypothetical protein
MVSFSLGAATRILIQEEKENYKKEEEEMGKKSKWKEKRRYL